MSSHHIIREKQEPALIVLGLDGFSEELLGQLLEWSPTLIATPATAEQINMHGIKIDMIIADELEDSLQLDVKLIPRGNQSFITAALNFLIQEGYPAVNVVADELVAADYLTYANQLNLVIFLRDQRIYPVTSGFSKWKPAGETIQILNPLQGVHLTGLKAIGADFYTTEHDGFFTLRFPQPFLLIAEGL